MFLYDGNHRPLARPQLHLLILQGINLNPIDTDSRQVKHTDGQSHYRMAVMTIRAG